MRKTMVGLLASLVSLSTRVKNMEVLERTRDVAVAGIVLIMVIIGGIADYWFHHPQSNDSD